jgi:hypothetical protein
LRDGFAQTGFFLARHVCDPHGEPLPAARHHFIEAALGEGRVRRGPRGRCDRSILNRMTGTQAAVPIKSGNIFSHLEGYKSCEPLRLPFSTRRPASA